jgi:NAD(P)-dependent dehydrogenase (short-subunit alcohol dehydrogenase family)
MDLRNKIALITGGRRMGSAIAGELAARGVDVAFAYATSKSEAESAAARVEARGRRGMVVQANLSDAGSCRALVTEVADAFGGLDILINMASTYVETPFEDLTAEAWDHALAIDLRATFLCSHAAALAMRANGGGRIVNFSDWTARSGRPRYRGLLPYYVAKSGVIALTEALALELADDGILVNAIAPGPILPPPSMTPDERRAVEEATPLGRWGGEEEIVKAVVALLDSDFITGETIRVDGGRHVR